jgi:hypothetical protein
MAGDAERWLGFLTSMWFGVEQRSASGETYRLVFNL